MNEQIEHERVYQTHSDEKRSNKLSVKIEDNTVTCFYSPGWKDNPVEFDSIFNQSLKTWCWGSPDILRIFDRGTENIASHSYNADQIDFGDKDPSKLDRWVFKNVEEFFSKPDTDGILQQELEKNKIVFFLHLLGIDTNGHARKPDSKQYLQNIELVDSGIKKVVDLIESYYNNDNKTVFILTSDHGMTPWGAHGTGLKSETETPFIAWGAGIKKPNIGRNINNDVQSVVWGLEDFERHDVQQVDITPLMSFLIGTSIPVNSVGILPYDVLDVSHEHKAEGMLLNAKQILKQYTAHEKKVQDNSFFFKKYQQMESFDLDLEFQRISQVIITDKDFKSAIGDCEVLIQKGLDGIKYYHQYNRLFLSCMVNLGFAAWIIYVITKILKEHTNILKASCERSVNILSSKLFGFVYYGFVTIVAFLLWIRSTELTHIVYTLFPFVTWKLCSHGFNSIYWLIVRVIAVFKSDKYAASALCFHVIIIIAGVEIIVIAFFHRGSLSVIALVLSLLPWMKLFRSATLSYTSWQKFFCCLWTITSLIVSIFPQLPVITREENYFLVMLAGFFATMFGVMYSFLFKGRDSHVIWFITGMLMICLVVKMSSVISVKNGEGLSLINQLFSWSSLLLLPGVAILSDSQSISRLISVSLSLFSIYILTSVAYDALFLLVLITQMAMWVTLEVFVFVDGTTSKTHKEDTNLTLDHLRIAFMFVYFIFLSFFGTGNIASINSFDVATTYCFKTVFNPWIQGILLALKVFVPFTVVTIFFRSLQSLKFLPMRALFLVILLLTDLMALNFFFLVKDEGSWLDVGQSLSHFLISLIFTLMLVPVYELSYFISGNIKVESVKLHLL